MEIGIGQTLQYSNYASQFYFIIPGQQGGTTTG